MNYSVRKMISTLFIITRPSLRNVRSKANIQHSSNLENLGISHLGQILSKDQCLELKSYFSKLLVFNPYSLADGEYLPGSDKRNPDSHIGHHFPSDILNAPYLLDLANNPKLLEIASEFLGCKPTLSYLAVWWSYSTKKGAQQAENFHRDVDDWRFLKLFVYLTDVGDKNGPHVYVKKSSASPKCRKIKRYDDSEVISNFGQENILILTGSAGEGFFEDTFGIHKGQPVEEGVRLIFQVVYSIFPLPYGPKRPIMSGTDLSNSSLQMDPWVNRVYLLK